MPGSRVDIHNVWKSFVLGGRVIDVLCGLDLTLPAGAMVAVVGSSGAGKSTLLHVLGALDRPTKGTIEYDGVRLEGRSAKDLADFRNHTIGFVFQFHHLLPDFNALENCAMPALIARVSRPEALRRAKALLDRVGIGERLQHRPGELSGGEQQRVALARALMLEPRVLLADEPTGNLDSKTGGEIHQLIVELNRERGMTMLVVTHNPDMAARMPKVLHMVDGRLLELPSEQQAEPGAARPIALDTPAVVDRPAALDQLARSAHDEGRRRAGGLDLIFGGLLLAAGLAATLGSYLYAANSGGGKYLVTYGLVLVGVARVIRGLVRRGRPS